MRGLLREMLRLSERRQPFAVCSVIATEGSVPGRLGATMIVTPDGEARGTVGGAGLEERVKAAAVEALRGGRGGVHHFDLAHWKPEGLNSVCGGSVDVSILVHRAVPHLLLIGGGHCGKALSELAATLEWDVTVIDARPEFANPDRFPQALATHAGDVARWCQTEDLQDFSHVYLLGHSWEIDTEALSALLPRFDGFVGVIGSQAKRRAMFTELRRRGVAESLLDRIRCPVGADIGAETPAEIAVSIAAEVISTLKQSPKNPLKAMP